MKLEAVMLTDVGVVRDHNEDSVYVDPAARFFVVADGMGGHAAGEVASAMAVETVKKTLDAAVSLVDAFVMRPTDNARKALVQLLQSAVLAAHQAVYQRGSKEADKAGMGTTLDVVLVAGREAFVAHVGDSRTYLIRDGKAAQLTTDHTVAEVLVIEGKLTIEEALVSPYRTVLVNAIGVAADVGVEMAHLQLREGDKLLLCSDGLHDYFLVEQEIADMLGADPAVDAIAKMIDAAKERGGHDNITGVIVTVIDLIDAVPNPIGDDSTQPVDVGSVGGATWSEDESTENISPRELDRLGSAFGKKKPASEAATRPTMPMTAPVPPPPDLPGSEVGALDATDPAIPVQPKLVVGDRAVDGEGPTVRGGGPTLPAPVRDKLAHDDTGPTPKTDGDKPGS
ncbi:MAG: serine/threonine-protein phosphatase [Myxococcales bacterium]|nr:serine/threonine-protein phosphatase [Myxococcales bacterium]MBK7191643.1 serine/threonine-protein phosphatase [Myxococcales bacterium]MBP6843915.1 serine/threonine-protein phosphatase [Kofleriaceae bacterium]